MNRTFYKIMISLTCLLVLAACKSDYTGPELENDESIVSELAVDENDEYLFDLGLGEDGFDNLFGESRPNTHEFGKVTGPIESVINFGRHVWDRPRRVVVDVRFDGGDTMRVAVERVLGGDFTTIAAVGDSLTDSVAVYQKRLSHLIQRNLVFARTEPGSDRRWRLDQLSMGQGNSMPDHSVTFKQVIVTGSNGSKYVLSTPLEHFFQLEDIPTFTVGEEVTVVVRLKNETGNPVHIDDSASTEQLLLHYGTSRESHNRKFFDFVEHDATSDELVYEGTWTIGQEARIYHAIIDAIDNGTIYDDDAELYPYNSTTWGLPYRVVATD